MKTFKEFQEMTTAGDAGIPQDTKDMGSKKRRHKVISRNFIEVMGKRRRITK